MGDIPGMLRKALSGIGEKSIVTRRSSIYRTAPWGKSGQSDFLNQVLEVETKLSAQELIDELLRIEEKLGRRREEKFGPRLIDIDIIFFNDEIISQPGLTIPHPQVQNRRFALVPLNELAPNHIHPVFQKTIYQLLLECPDTLAVNKTEHEV